jgi:hypothetical protein
LANALAKTGGLTPRGVREGNKGKVVVELFNPG